MGIADRYKLVSEEVKQTCENAGRPEDSVLLLAVSKTVGLDGVSQAIVAGCEDFGENRPDQLMEKHAAFPSVRWHFIGNVQSRRIKDIVPCAHMIHSVHELKHAHKIDEEARKLDKVQNVLIEVNVSGEESKSGISPQEASDFLAECLKLSNLRVCGLMTMAPQGDLSMAQRCFAGLAQLLDLLREESFSDCEDKREAFTQLSMGMSEDWVEAIHEGSTTVRIGRAIFSDDF